MFRRKGLRQQRGREEVFGGHENGSFRGKGGEIAKEEMEALIVGRKTQHHSNIHMLAWLPACFSLTGVEGRKGVAVGEAESEHFLGEKLMGVKLIFLNNESAFGGEERE